MGVDEEAKQHIVALAQKLHDFGHRTEEREMELWRRLGGAIEVPTMAQRWADYQ